MTKRLSISITDELAAQVQEHKKQLNVSAVCAEALDRRCKTLESNKQGESAMQAVISRFRAQKAETETESKEQGFQMGHSFITEEADLSITKDLANFYEMTRHEPWDMWKGLESTLSQDWENQIHELAEFVQRNDLDYGEFAEGFVQGVADVWDRIKGEVD